MYILVGILLVFLLAIPFLCVVFLMIDDLVFGGLLSEHLQDRAKKWLEDKINNEEKH